MESGKLKTILINLGKFLLVFGMLFYIWRSGRLDPQKLATAMKRWELVLPGFALLFLPNFILGFRLKLLLLGQGIRVSYWKAFQLTLIGVLFNTCLPGAVSGDLVKGYYIFKDNSEIRKTQAFMAMLVDRIIGLSGLILVCSTVILLFWSKFSSYPDLKPMMPIVLALFAGASLFYLMVFIPVSEDFKQRIKDLTRLPGGKYLHKIAAALRVYKGHKRIILVTLLASASIHTIVVIAVFLFTQAMGETQLDLTSLYFVVPIGLITTAIPIAPAGIGVGHVAFLELFRLLGSNVGAEVFTIHVTGFVALGLVGIIPYLSLRKGGIGLSEMQSKLSEDQGL